MLTYLSLIVFDNIDCRFLIDIITFLSYQSKKRLKFIEEKPEDVSPLYIKVFTFSILDEFTKPLCFRMLRTISVSLTFIWQP